MSQVKSGMTLPFTMAIIAALAAMRASFLLFDNVGGLAGWIPLAVAGALIIAAFEHLWHEVTGGADA